MIGGVKKQLGKVFELNTEQKGVPWSTISLMMIDRGTPSFLD